VKVFLFDTVSGYGGGQVVLEVLQSSLSNSGVSPVVIKKANIRDNLRIITGETKNSITENGDSLKSIQRHVFVANANKTLSHVVILGLLMKVMSNRTAVVFIGHNYPRNVFRSLVLRALTIFVNVTICVDPSLERKFFKTVRAPLLVSAGEVRKKPLTTAGTSRVVSYQRADKVKGGLRLPPIFRTLTAKGFKCEIALDEPIDRDYRYSEQLRRELEPWLVDGRKDRMWLEHGDIFLLSSYSETAALSAQEALYRGCHVVASNVGIIHELSQIAPAIRVVEPWTTDSVCKEILEIASLSEVQRDEAIGISQAELSSVSGKWIEFVTNTVLDFDRAQY
jgi:glycosyltransferase involved in cell wall biosynthesis